MAVRTVTVLAGAGAGVIVDVEVNDVVIVDPWDTTVVAGPVAVTTE